MCRGLKPVMLKLNPGPALIWLCLGFITMPVFGTPLSIDDIRALSNRDLCARAREYRKEYEAITTEREKRQLSCDDESLANSGIEYAPEPLITKEPVKIETAPESDTPVNIPAPSPAPLNPTASVVRISAGTRAGSGFYIADTVVVTNAHVVEGHTSVWVAFSGMPPTEGTVIYRNDTLDFAAVMTSVKGVPLAIRHTPPNIGEAVETLGFPQGRQVLAYSTGTVIERVDCCIVHDALIAGGSSGGPLLDANHQVLGLNTMLSKSRGDRANESDRTVTVTLDFIKRKILRPSSAQ